MKAVSLRLAILLGGWALVAGCSMEFNNPHQSDPVGEITGRLVTASGRSLPAASADGAPVQGAVCTLEGSIIKTSSNSEGGFRMIDVPVGSYLLLCRKDQFGTSRAFLGPVVVEDGKVADLGVLEVTPTGAIAGRARIPNAAELTGTRIEIPGTSMQASTDGAGFYLLSAVPAGTFTVRFSHDGYLPMSLEGVRVESEQTTTLADITLEVSTGPSGVVVLNNGDEYSASRQVAVAITTTGGATVMALSESVDFVNAKWEPIATTKSWQFAADGAQKVYAKFANRDGLESPPVFDDILIDSLPPTGVVIINQGAVATNQVQVALTMTASDEVSGVAEMKVSNREDLQDASWQPYHTPLAWTLQEGDGPKLVTAVFRDRVGHESAPAQAGILLDTQAPVDPQITIDEGEITAECRLHLSLAAPNAVQVILSADPEFKDATWQPFQASLQWTVNPCFHEMDVTIYGRFQDEVGNLSPVVSASIEIDQYSPTDPIFATDYMGVLGPNGVTNAHSLTLTLVTPSEDAHLLTYQAIGGQYQDYTDVGLVEKLTFNFTEEGYFFLGILAKDRAGNVSEQEELSLIMERCIDEVCERSQAPCTEDYECPLGSLVGNFFEVQVDWTPPAIEVYGLTVRPTSAVLSVYFSEPGLASLEYGKTGGGHLFLTQLIDDEGYYQFYLADLEEGSEYEYRVSETDYAGNQTTTDWDRFVPVCVPSCVNRCGGSDGCDGTCPDTCGALQDCEPSSNYTRCVAEGCVGVTCSYQGSCRNDGSGAYCLCYVGYHAEGLTCVVDPGPDCTGKCGGPGCTDWCDGSAGLYCDPDSGYTVCVNGCAGITCSSHGTCGVWDDGEPYCDCVDPYFDDGLECILD